MTESLLLGLKKPALLRCPSSEGLAKIHKVLGIAAAPVTVKSHGGGIAASRCVVSCPRHLVCGPPGFNVIFFTCCPFILLDATPRELKHGLISPLHIASVRIL